MRGLLKASGAIQITSAGSLIIQNLLAPRLMGPESYGHAVALMALPLLLQGMIEQMVNGAAIAARARTDNLASLRQVWTHLGLVILPVALLTLAYGVRRQATTWQLTLLVFFALIVLLNTALRGLAFAGRRHRILVSHFLGAFLVTAVTLPLLVLAGSTGYLAMMCCVQLSILVILLYDGQVRAEAAEIVARPDVLDGEFGFARTYAANLGVRAGQLTIGPGMLLVAASQLTSVRLAEFRVCQALVGAVAYGVPINAPLIQAHAAAGGRAAANGGRGGSRGFVGVVILGLSLASILTILVWMVYPLVAEVLLSLEPGMFEFRNMVWAAPFVVFVPLLGGMLLGMGFETAVLTVNVMLVPVSIAIGLWSGAQAGFTIGSIALAVSLGLCAWRCPGSDGVEIE